MILTYAFRVYRQSQKVKGLRIPSIAMAILVPIQITLGAFTVLSRKAVDITTIHVAVGALILVTSVITTLMIYRVLPQPARELHSASDLQEVMV
jgi:heme A synthase